MLYNTNVYNKAILIDLSLRLIPTKEGYKASNDFKISYQSIVGLLMYTILSTRPDIAFSVSIISRYTSNPDDSYFKVVKDIYRYLRGTTNYELCFQGTLKSLTGYTNAL
jgi:hypothetical protein